MRNILDLSVVYRVAIELDSNGVGSYIIKPEMLDTIDLKEEEMFEIVKNNHDFEVKNISEIIGDELGYIPEEEAFPLYVVTNIQKTFGAGVLVSDYLNDIYAKYGKVKIIPSSIHEILILPENFASITENAFLLDMVKCVNQTEVTEEDILTTSVYEYSPDKGLQKVA